MGETDSTVKLIETVAKHGYLKIAEMIDDNRLDEACKVVEILKGVGIV